MSFFLIILLLVAFFIWLQFRSKRLSVGRNAELRGAITTERTLFSLQIGDVVQYQERDWILESIYHYQQDRFEWIEYLLRDNKDAAWLVVVEDDWLEVSWLTPISENELQISMPPSNIINYKGLAYTLKEQGVAEYTTEGRIKNQSGTCRFYDYRASQDRILSLEVYGNSRSEEDIGDLDINVGIQIDARLLSLLPGDGKSVYANVPRC